MTQETARARGSQPALYWTGKRVLLVEDDPRDCDFYFQVFAAHGFDVKSCRSVTEGERLLEKEHYDFVLLEQGTHAFEGRRVLERVAAIDRHLPAVVVTRCVDMQCYLEAMQMGAVDYLEKPLSESEVLRVVETHIPPRATA